MQAYLRIHNVFFNNCYASSFNGFGLSPATRAACTQSSGPCPCKDPDGREERWNPGLCCRGLHIFKTIMNFNSYPLRETVLQATRSFSLPPSLAHTDSSSVFSSLFPDSSSKTRLELLIHDMRMLKLAPGGDSKLNLVC